MLASIAPLLALVLYAQAAPLIPTGARPTTGETAVAVNDTVTLDSPLVMAADLASLNALIDLSLAQGLTDDAKRARYKVMVQEGRVYELKEPTRVVIHDIILDNGHSDQATGKPMPIYSGLLLNGPHSRQKAFLLASQLPDIGEVESRPPTAGELVQAKASDQAADLREQQIYREYRAGKNAAKAKAGAAHVSVRKHTEQRALTVARDTLLKKYKLSSGELDAIVAQGEAKDGTADRNALKNNPAIAAAKYRNDVALDQIGQMVDAGINQSLKEAANWRPARIGRLAGETFNPLGLGGYFLVTPRSALQSPRAPSNSVSSSSNPRYIPGH